MLKFEEYLDFDFWVFGFGVVFVFCFFLDFGLDEEGGLVDDGLGILG
jgi:hypothetical protein